MKGKSNSEEEPSGLRGNNTGKSNSEEEATVFEALTQQHFTFLKLCLIIYVHRDIRESTS
ncbi:hypothetical protein DPMN_058581 [Dreissena polymorpha]|uniref:Uncharacterized protein n=1 Tax=Dreissena polymorpha TaxID=45954 RepID=A0A9D4C2D2_DREPO|nr:hypothetical protein DPMN_058581 [Dreissena polymorpha]